MFESGQRNAVCDRCGFVFKASQLRLEPVTALRVCAGAGTTGCYDPRHPLQDPKPISPDRQTPPWTRPEGPDRFRTDRVEWDDL